MLSCWHYKPFWHRLRALRSSRLIFYRREIVLSRCTKSTPQKLVNDLLFAMFNDAYLANHSLGGKSSKESTKEGLPVEAVEQMSFVLLLSLLQINLL
jgi:hypothetical protein